MDYYFKCSYGVILLKFGNNNQVIEKLISKFRQSFIISEKPVI